MSLRFPKGSRKNRHPTNIRHFGDERTFGERITDAVAARVGSWPFIIVQTVLLFCSSTLPDSNRFRRSAKSSMR